MATDNHDLSKPPRGITGWDTDWYQNFDHLDTAAEIRDLEGERFGYVPKEGAKFFATDTENIFIGGETGWEQVDSAGPTPSFDTVVSGSLFTDEIESDRLNTFNEFILPQYDQLSEAPQTTASLVYATGADDPEGVYRYNGSSYIRLSSGSGGGVNGASGTYSATGDGSSTEFTFDTGIDTTETSIQWVSVDATTQAASTDYWVSYSGSTITIHYTSPPNDGVNLGWDYFASTDAGSDGGGSGGDGVSSLSELSIDTNKDWRGYDINNLGQVTASSGEFETLQATTAPTADNDVTRRIDLENADPNPHGNEAHTETYLTEDDIGDSEVPNPHGNDYHTEEYATTTQVDAKADEGHGNESHSPNFSETSHRHSGHTITPDAVETGSLQTGSILGSISGGETVDDITGDNLYISEGTLHANSGSTATGKSHVEYHDIDDYGADPTGGDYSDAALDDAIAALSDGDYLVMTQGNYRFQEAHTITNDYITVTGEGSLIRNEYDTYAGSPSMLRFLGSINSTSSPDTLNASSIQPGDQYVQVDDASGFSVGDDIMILERKDGSSPHTGYYRSIAQTRSIIRHIDGNTIYLTRGSSYYHGSGRAGIWRIDACKRPRVFDMHMRGGSAEKFLTFRFTRNGHMERCYAQNCTGFAYQLFYGFRNTMVDCVSKHPTYTDSRASSQQEHFRILGETDPVLVNPVIEDCRRGIDINFGSDVVTIINPLITNAQLHGICFHNNSEQHIYGAFEVYGGRIEGKQQRVTNDIYHHGYGISLSRNQLGVKVIGTDVVGRKAAIHSPGGGCDNTTLKGCNFSTVPGSDLTDLVEVGGDNWTIDGCDLYPNSGQNAIQSMDSSMSDVKIINNHIEGDVELGGATIDGYWFKNNYWTGGGSAPSGSDHFIRDNS